MAMSREQARALAYSGGAQYLANPALEGSAQRLEAMGLDYQAKMAKEHARRRQEFYNALDTNMADWENLSPAQFAVRVQKLAAEKGVKPGDNIKGILAAHSASWAKQDKTALTQEAVNRREKLVAPYAEQAGKEIAFSEVEPGAETVVPYGAQTRRDVGGMTVAGPLAETLDEAQMTMQEIFDMASDEGMRTGELGAEARERVKALRGENEARSKEWRDFFGTDRKDREKLSAEAQEYEALAAAADAKGLKELANYWRGGGRVKDAKLLQDIGILPEKAVDKDKKWVVTPSVDDNGDPITLYLDPETLDEKKRFKRPKTTPQVQVQVGGDKAGTEAAAKTVVDLVKNGYEKYQTAPELLMSLQEARKLIPSSITGTGAEKLLMAAKTLKRFGINIPDADMTIRDTEKLRSVLQERVAANLKLVFGGQLTEGERAFLQDSFGRIDTDPNALNGILDFYEDKIRSAITRHNALFDSVRGYFGPADLSISIPEKFRSNSGVRVLGYE